MSVAGSILLTKGMKVAVDTYSSKDTMYTVSTESGWGCHFMKQKLGFHADAKKNQAFKKGWNLVSQWEDHSSVNSELYNLGGSIASNGYYHAPETGYYACSAQIRLDSADKSSYFRLLLALNGDKDVNQGTVRGRVSCLCCGVSFLTGLTASMLCRPARHSREQWLDQLQINVRSGP